MPWKWFNIEANIVALSGIAIAIGTMIDLGIVLSENIIKHLKEKGESEPLGEIIYKAAAEVSSAIVVAVSTTIVSFIPIFTLEAAEGKLFQPLAYTKTFALIAALLVTLIILPTLAHWFFGLKLKSKKAFHIQYIGFILLGIGLVTFGYQTPGYLLILLGVINGIKTNLKIKAQNSGWLYVLLKRIHNHSTIINCFGDGNLVIG